MAGIIIKRLLPAFIPIAYEVVRHFKRNSDHNSDIKRFDQSGEKLNTIEHLIVRLEKKAQASRDEIRTSNTRLQIWLGINSAMLVAILVKIFIF